MNVSRITLLKLAALACLVAAYRSIAHGVTLNDDISFWIGCSLLALGVVATVSAIQIGDRRK